jgi:hypothetical protein
VRMYVCLYACMYVLMFQCTYVCTNVCALSLSLFTQDYRKRFSDHWRAVCKGIRFPSRDTVFDYFLHLDSFKFEPWKSNPLFYVVKFDPAKPMSSVLVPTPETVSVTYWTEVRCFERCVVLVFSFETRIGGCRARAVVCASWACGHARR